MEFELSLAEIYCAERRQVQNIQHGRWSELKWPLLLIVLQFRLHFAVWVLNIDMFNINGETVDGLQSKHSQCCILSYSKKCVHFYSSQFPCRTTTTGSRNNGNAKCTRTAQQKTKLMFTMTQFNALLNRFNSMLLPLKTSLEMCWWSAKVL